MASTTARRSPAADLPPFPWDTIAEFKSRAAAHADGMVNLSIGAPSDEVPAAARTALADAANSPGYPQVPGIDELRGAYVAWLERVHGVSVDRDHVLPTIGSKELISSLPTQLGLGAESTVAIPELGYPSYEVGALVAGATPVRTTAASATEHDGLSLLWLNSPSNPTGEVLDRTRMAAIVAWAREHGVIVASDECYLDLGWDAAPLSVLHDDISGGDHTGLLALHSLSKRSNLAGYRLGFVAGDPALVDRLTLLRKHLGLMVPAPVQAAGIAALTDDAHVMAQRRRYAKRRETLRDALTQAGFTIEHSEAGLYLWATRGEPALETVARLADLGILVAPGTFYGEAGAQHVRVALTATDEQVAAAARRLAA